MKVERTFRRHALRLGGLLALGLGLLLSSVPADETGQAHVAKLTLDGAIGPATTDYLTRSMERATADGARLIVIRMDTPGGLDAATRDIIQAILQSPVPVATYVHPAGARAASAGTYILYGSHIAAMTPSTNLGAATPVQMGGSLALQTDVPVVDDLLPDDEEAADETAREEEDAAEAEEQTEGLSAAERKVINDSVAYIRGLAERHGRNADWAERAVREAVSLTASEALAQNVVDIVATDIEDLIAQADGRVVQMEHSTQIIEAADLPILDYDPDWRNEFLALITSPQIAYLLLLIGIYGLILEGYNPGSLVPGVIGAISLLLGLYALQMLPINYVGLALMALGALLIVAEAFVPSFGILGIGGVVALVLGSIMLIDTDVPGMEMPYEVIGAVAAVSGIVVLYIVLAVGKVLRMKTVPSDQAMVGLRGVVRSAQGDVVQVLVNGELWRASVPGVVQPGQAVRVTEQKGLKLQVEPLDEPAADQKP
ncbi:nodulation protein NfeD [Natronospirillum operosum]|uniref:Nodulation protein NfeD n=1 Tax=Natronospirillum operosum TaxID=2759953 RepID=A0A4Z0WL44_9GAMM|nr:nodulation protein NfeD [Natronospirillum operosum]TGG96091.1 nodulation protein NfeD [Natronospirillum operosum]